MSGKILITGLVAGIIAFVWGMLSWMVLPFHKGSIDKLTAAPIAVEAIKKAAPDSGVYYYPEMDASKEDKMKTPHVLVVTNYADKNMATCMLKGLGIQILSGIALAFLVATSRLEKFADRMKLILAAVLFAAFVCHLPNWLWWGFTLKFTILAIVDLLIAWSIAGIWISKRA